jgi:hypothetical protein
MNDRHRIVAGAVAVFSLSLIFIGLLMFLFPKNDWATTVGDSHNFLSMARGQWESIPGVYGSRILTPFLIRLLPVDPYYGFQIFDWLVLSIASVLCYYFVYDRTSSMPLSVLAGVFFVSSFGIVFHLSQPWLVDPLAYVLCLIALWSLSKRNLWVFVLTTVVGVLNKEVALLLIPSAFVVFLISPDARDKDFSRRVLFLGLVGGILMEYALVQILTRTLGASTSNTFGFYLNPSYIKETLYGKLSAQYLPGFLVDVFFTFGWVWIVALWGVIKTQKWTTVELVYALGISSQVIFADTKRALFFLFPLVIYYALLGLESLMLPRNIRLLLSFSMIGAQFFASMVPINQGKTQPVGIALTCISALLFGIGLYRTAHSAPALKRL